MELVTQLVTLEQAKSLVAAFLSSSPKTGDRLTLKVEGTPGQEIAAWLISTSQEIAENTPAVKMCGRFNFTNHNRWTGEMRRYWKFFTESGRSDPASAAEIARSVPERLGYLLEGVVPFDSTVLDLRVHETDGPW